MRYYRRFYRLVAVAVAVLAAVLTGSLVLGDSVRGSLMSRVDERLAGAETVVTTGTGFLSDSILAHRQLATARGYLLVEGYVNAGGTMVPVSVWGTDDDSLSQGEALVNEEFRMEDEEFPIVLHLPSTNLVPSSSLFVSQRYATQLRLQVKGVKTAAEGGNLLLRNEQVRPLNVFMNRRELAQALGVSGKLNVILSPDHITEEDFHRAWRPEYSGLTFHRRASGATIVGADRVFLSSSLVDVLKPQARYLAYFVNSLGTIPYSFVTATDQLKGDETVLSDYAARRLGVGVGDSVTMDYYVSRGQLKQLETASHRFCVSRIAPVSEFQQQSDLLSADFPGLAGVARCTDWDSDLPIDMSRITRADEDYWTTYRQTPKALVSLEAVASDWTGYYGVATKVVLAPLSAPEGAASVKGNEALSGAVCGAMVSHPRAAALQAAQQGTDFGLLFLALGFFIIIAAILLMQGPLAEMYQLRQPEIRLYSTLGFSRRRVFGRLFREALPTLPWATIAGLLLGYGYAALILWLLAGPWSGATHTSGFALHANPVTALVAWLLSLLIAVTVLGLTLRAALRADGAKGHPQEPAPLRLLTSAMARRFSLFTLHSSFLSYYRHQHRLSFWALMLGVLVVFAVGLNRPNVNHFSTTTTGGYDYYAESRIPIAYDLNTVDARRHLHIANMPAATRFLQLPKHTEAEASCLNLNRVATPSVLGMKQEDMKRFGITSPQPPPKEGERVPVYIDEEALLWSMMRSVGDTLAYHASDGRQVEAVIAGTYPTGIFHGTAIMPIDSYRQLWPDEMGTRILLADTSLTSHLSLLTSHLSDYGLAVATTQERLLMFFEVTDTYLSIFMSLGGIGLLLGLASLIIVIRKNLAARLAELRLYRALGFPAARVVTMLRRQQLVVPLLAIAAGAVGCLLLSLLTRRWGLALPPITDAAWLTALVLLLVIVAFSCIIVILSINQKTIRQCETS